LGGEGKNGTYLVRGTKRTVQKGRIHVREGGGGVKGDLTLRRNKKESRSKGRNDLVERKEKINKKKATKNVTTG